MKVTILKAGGKLSNSTRLDSNTIQFNGPSHENGGIPISYAGKKVEVEGDETGYFSPIDNSLNIMGNMTNPLTGRKFKSDSKILADKETRVNKIINKGSELVNKSNPYDRWEQLSFNSGEIMMKNGAKKIQELTSSKEHLSELQNAMLDISKDMGVDPQKFSKGKLVKAKYGYKLQEGDKLSMAQRNNNPGNMKYASWMKKYGAVPSDPGADGGQFAKFPSVEQGQAAMKELLFQRYGKNTTVERAISKWTGGSPYKIPLDNLSGRTLGSLSEEEQVKLLDVFTRGEDSKSYNWDNTASQTPSRQTFLNRGTPVAPRTPERITDRTINPPNNTTTPTPWQSVLTPGNYTPTGTPNTNVPSNARGLGIGQILPEIAAFATNRQEFVPLQQYDPQLFQDYQISLQDRRNLNASTFNALKNPLGSNPEALSYLAGQKYEADNAVNAEEFRINQGIQNEVTNKNVNLLNDAQLKNLQFADTQYVRQAQAKSNTKAINQSIMNSISGKIAQNRLEQQTLQLYENLYPHFRFDEQGRAINVIPGTEEDIQWGPALTPSASSESQVTRTFDKAGQLQKTNIMTPPESLIKGRQLENQNREFKNLRNNMNVSRLFKLNKYNYND